MAQTIITQIVGGRVDGAQTFITGIVGSGASAAQTVITKIVGGSVGSFSVNPGTPQTVKPFQVVRMVATVTTAGFSADSWTWTQASGTPVVLVGAGSAVAYRAPATMNGDTLTFQVVAHLAGLPDSTPPVVTHTVLPHAGRWMYSSSKGALVGIERRLTARDPLATTTGLGLIPLGIAPLGG